jgi:hypothetical protein
MTDTAADPTRPTPDYGAMRAVLSRRVAELSEEACCLRTALAIARGEIDRLREALEPFAEAAGNGGGWAIAYEDCLRAHEVLCNEIVAVTSAVIADTTEGGGR